VPTNDYQDDPTIPDDADLWRRIPRWHLVNDESIGQIRPSSAAFEDHPDGSPMSVVLGAESRGAESVLAGYPGFALASIKAGLARECQQGVARDPLPEEPAHAVVFGHKTKSVRKRLAREATWVVAPPSS
jgi:hypothetical protein